MDPRDFRLSAALGVMEEAEPAGSVAAEILPGGVHHMGSMWPPLPACASVQLVLSVAVLLTDVGEVSALMALQNDLPLVSGR